MFLRSMLVEQVISALRHATYRTHEFSEACSGCADAESLLIELDHSIGHESKLTCSDTSDEWWDLAKQLPAISGAIK